MLFSRKLVSVYRGNYTTYFPKEVILNLTINTKQRTLVTMRGLFCLLVLTFLAACVSVSPEYRPPAPGLERFDMYQAQVFLLKQATELRFEIGGPYVWENEVLARASNPITGENFVGRLMLMGKDNTSTAVVTNAWGFKKGEIHTTSDGKTKIARGILKGDKGTAINLTIETQRVDEHRPGGGAPFYYRGFGEGTDNHGESYTIQFSGNFHVYWAKNGDEFLKATGRDFGPKE